MKTLPNRRHTGLWIGVGLILAFAGAGIYWAARGIPPVDQQFPQNSYPLSISITSPSDSSSWPADAFIPIQASLTGTGSWDEIELWVDGKLQDSILAPGPASSSIFTWMPGQPGRFRLILRALYAGKAVASSNPINLEITEPAGFLLRPVELDLESSQEEYFPSGSLTGFSQPVPPISQPAASPSEGIDTTRSDFSFWARARLSLDTAPPEPPLLTYSFSGCDLQLQITDQSANELGFFLYRSPAGSASFARIMTLAPAQGGSIPVTPGYLNETGAIYYAAAFNTGGETSSAPVLVGTTPEACPAIEFRTKDATELEEEYQVLDLAYFYYAFDRGTFRRYPASPDRFLTPSESPTSLQEMLHALAQTSPALVQRADLVLWGWEGGNLVNLGAVSLDVDDSRLLVCNLGTNCTGDVASNFRSDFGELANDQEDQVREFYWATSAPGTDAVLWQISSSPFTAAYSPHPTGLLAAGCVSGSAQGSFLLDFADLNSYGNPPAACGIAPQPNVEFNASTLLRPYFQPEEEYFLIRFTPMAGNQPAGRPSNTVVLYAHPGTETIEPVIVDHLPEIYDIEIVEFNPVKYMNPDYWGCVSVISYDYQTILNAYKDNAGYAYPETLVKQAVDDLVQKLQYVMDNDLLICPTDYEKEDESILGEWFSMFTEGLSEMWATVTEAFEDLKSGIVNLAAEALNTVGIDCNPTCKGALQAGLEIGVAYFTGMPPTLPDFKQLANEGIEYAIELAAAEAGVPCPEICQEALREGLNDMVDRVIQGSSQPACGNANWAHVLGKNAFCLPPGIDTEPYSEGLTAPASVKIKVTRSSFPDQPDYEYYDQASYLVKIDVRAQNENITGYNYLYVYSFLEESAAEICINDDDCVSIGAGSSHTESIYINVSPQDPSGKVFETEYVPVPPLPPGESIIIPVTLRQATYYFPEHILQLAKELNDRGLTLDTAGGLGGSRGIYFDWTALYQSSRLEVNAELRCLEMPSGLIGTTQPGEDSGYTFCGASAGPIFVQEPHDPILP